MLRVSCSSQPLIEQYFPGGRRFNRWSRSRKEHLSLERPSNVSHACTNTRSSRDELTRRFPHSRDFSERSQGNREVFGVGGGSNLSCSWVNPWEQLELPCQREEKMKPLGLLCSWNCEQESQAWVALGHFQDQIGVLCMTVSEVFLQIFLFSFWIFLVFPFFPPKLIQFYCFLPIWNLVICSLSCSILLLLITNPRVLCVCLCVRLPKLSCNLQKWQVLPFQSYNFNIMFLPHWLGPLVQWWNRSLKSGHPCLFPDFKCFLAFSIKNDACSCFCLVFGFVFVVVCFINMKSTISSAFVIVNHE